MYFYTDAPIIETHDEFIEKLENESLYVECEVDAKPYPSSVQWLYGESDTIVSDNEILNIPSITSDDAGEYTCRARNTIKPCNTSEVDRETKSTVVVNVLCMKSKYIVLFEIIYA